MIFPNGALRRTGRTTQQIALANKLAEAGEDVIFVAHSMSFINTLKDKLSPNVGVGSVRAGGNWSWDEFRIQGYAEDTNFIVDHYAFEQEFISRGEKILEQNVALQKKNEEITRLRNALIQIKNTASFTI